MSERSEQVEMFSTVSMSAIFSHETHVRAMLAFEAALAHSEAQVGIFSPEIAVRIQDACQIEHFDVGTLYYEAIKAGSLAIPLVKTLTTFVEGDAKGFVHWGATSQDVIDSATMLQMREGLDVLINDLWRICTICAKLAEQYRDTLMIGRTLLQQAVPITFGLKCVRWLSGILSQVEALHERKKQSLALQFGGAAGTLAALGSNGLHVGTLLATELDLPLPDLPWHTERSRIVEVTNTLGVVAGTMAKVAQDLVLLSQTEVGEVSERIEQGKGGSSAMPQKHNPVDAIEALAAARLALGEVPVMLSAMVQEHERAAGGWQAEWIAIPNIFRYTASAVQHVLVALSDLRVDSQTMNRNVHLTHGLVMAESLTTALAQYMGKPDAQSLVQVLCMRCVQAGSSLRDIAMKDEQVRAVLSEEATVNALEPALYLGSAGQFIDRVLASYHEQYDQYKHHVEQKEIYRGETGDHKGQRHSKKKNEWKS